MARQQRRNHRIASIARLQRSIASGTGGNAGDRYHSHWLPLAFIIDVVERLVFDDRATQRRAKLIVMERRPRLADRIEIIAGIERIVTEIFCRASMELIHAALGDDVDDRT